jgi:hypothetical protein
MDDMWILARARELEDEEDARRYERLRRVAMRTVFGEAA